MRAAATNLCIFSGASALFSSCALFCSPFISRNELAFCNDIFGTVRPKKASLQTQARAPTKSGVCCSRHRAARRRLRKTEAEGAALKARTVDACLPLLARPCAGGVGPGDQAPRGHHALCAELQGQAAAGGGASASANCGAHMWTHAFLTTPCTAFPCQELVLDYGANYWPTAGRSLRRGHEAFAERAAQVRAGVWGAPMRWRHAQLPGHTAFARKPQPHPRMCTLTWLPLQAQAIGVVYGALQWAGVDGAALAACLAPVDLEAAEHRRYRAFWP